MHELGLCSSIVDAIRAAGRDAPRRAGPGTGRSAAPRPSGRFRPVVRRRRHGHRGRRSRRRAGAAAGASPLRLLPANWEGDEMPLACPSCGSVDIELVGGDELLLESIEYRG